MHNGMASAYQYPQLEYQLQPTVAALPIVAESSSERQRDSFKANAHLAQARA